ncbi:MAG: cupredoxin domain-containing protein [Acidimicrobiales bacterium]|nr:cupredoxin domain-containing protein [Acidimicrobiales bacterium]
MTAIPPDRPEQAAVTRGRPGLNTETLALAGVFIAAFAFLAAIFAVGLAARAVEEVDHAGGNGGAAPATGAEAVPVSLEEFAITPGEVDVPAGAVLNISNEGTVVHNLSVDGIASEMVDGGATTELDLGSLAPGTYAMKCDVPGHAEAGMTGTLTVS